MADFTEDEEELIDRCIDESKPFHWLRHRILAQKNNPGFFMSDDDFYRQRMNLFLQQLIVYFPNKVLSIIVYSDYWFTLSEFPIRVIPY